MTVKKGFLTVCLVDDYHDFKYVASSMPALKLRSHELGTTIVNGNFKYVGILYNGDFPSEEQIDNCCQRLGVVVNE